MTGSNLKTDDPLAKIQLKIIEIIKSLLRAVTREKARRSSSCSKRLIEGHQRSGLRSNCPIHDQTNIVILFLFWNMSEYARCLIMFNVWVGFGKLREIKEWSSFKIDWIQTKFKNLPKWSFFHFSWPPVLLVKSTTVTNVSTRSRQGSMIQSWIWNSKV